MAVRSSITSRLTDTASDKLQEQMVSQAPEREEVEGGPQGSPPLTIFDQVAGQPVAEATQEEAAEVSTPFTEGMPDTAQREDILSGITQALETGMAVESQAEAGRIDDIQTRKEDTTDKNEYDYLGQYNRNNTGDAGFTARANALSVAIENQDMKMSRLDTVKSNLGPMFKKIGAYNANTNLPSREFTYILGLVTENALLDMSSDKDPDQSLEIFEDQSPFGTAETEAMDVPFSKAKGNKNLGDQISREYQRFLRRMNPDMEITELSNEEAILLGDFAKETYAAFHGPAMISRIVARDISPSFNRPYNDKQTYFQFTKAGLDTLKKSERERKRMFPKLDVKPLKNKPARGRLEGDIAKEKRNVSTKAGEIVNAQVIRKAMDNLSQVGNVVDTQRLKILLMTALPVLVDRGATENSVSAIINHVGIDKINKFKSKIALDKRKGKPTIDLEEEKSKLVNNLAQDIFGVVLERHGVNYLTYYMQGFNGRVAPQQSTLDPTTSKTARFVTRSGAPSIASDKDGNGKRIHRNLRQMYANALVKGGDSLLPDAREVALEAQTPQMYAWGSKLRDIVNGISDTQIEAVAQAIENRIPVNSPEFPKIPPISLDPEADKPLIEAIRKKGEDGQMYIDGLIDFANYTDAVRKAKETGKPFQYASYFNAYMDGKTNGLATNAIQMGSIEASYRIGVLRSQGKTLLDKDEDIRVQLKNLLLEDVDTNGFPGSFKGKEKELVAVAKALYSYKDFNKMTTMTFGYGKELASFKDDIEDYLYILSNKTDDREFDNQAFTQALQVVIGNDPKGMEKLTEALHAKYIPNLIQVLDDNALASRSIMRSISAIAALSDEMFSIQSPTGYMINLGGGVSTGSEKRIGYGIGTGDKVVSRGAEVFGTRFTSAAERIYRDDKGKISQVIPGEISFGGSVPAPVQSVDAATVAMTVTGKSWDRLTAASGGNPYIHTIYDAFKVDAMGYDVVLDEVNQNWLDINMNWSYLKKAKSSLKEIRKSFDEKFKERRRGDPLYETERSMLDYFGETDDSGEFKNLVNKISRYLPDNSKIDYASVEKLGYIAQNAQSLDDLKVFIEDFMDFINIESRLDEMIDVTEKKKRKLRKKIEEMGVEVYQYYSH